jgi:hypothetical protein
MQQTIPIRETEIAKQRHIAEELKQARKLGYDSFFGANRFTQRNPYSEGPFRDEWQLGREDAQYGRAIRQVEDEAFKRSYKYA